MESTADKAIRQATSALLRAINTFDLEAVIALWDDTGILMPPGHASVQGHQAIRAYFADLFRHYRFEFAFTSSEVNADGVLAVERVVYSSAVWSLEGGSSQRDRGKGLHVYRQHKGGSWKLIMDVWNSDGQASSSVEEDDENVSVAVDLRFLLATVRRKSGATSDQASCGRLRGSRLHRGLSSIVASRRPRVLNPRTYLTDPGVLYFAA